MQPSGTQYLNIGLFGIGLQSYWTQYEGLKARLEGYLQTIHDRLQGPDVRVVDLGLVDSPEKARLAGDEFKRADVSIIFLFVSTYALSSTVLPVVQQARVPVIVLNLQPVRAIDYAAFNALADRTTMTGEWLAHCQACAVPEIASVFNRAGIEFHQITGTLVDDADVWVDVGAWIDAARVARVMQRNRVGLLGHYYSGMLDIYSDPTQHSAYFGCHFEHVEMTELKGLRDAVAEEQVERKVAEIFDAFEVTDDCPLPEIRRAARTAVALDSLVAAHDLGSLAYFYDGVGDPEYEDIIASVIVGTSLLTGRHVPVAGEYELKNVQAMKIMDAFGVGGSFTEFYAMDFVDDVILMGHDGPGDIQIAQGKPKLKPLKEFHGKVGQGLSIEMTVKHGPVTMLSVVQSFDGKLRLLVAEAEAVPGAILEIGNTNSRYRFSMGVKAFIEAWCRPGPAHHCAVGVGHIAHKIEKLGAILGMDVIHVC